jgi:ADP-ribose pyrophosphatase
MEKPRWRRISSSYVVDSKYLRIRKDCIELPSGAILPEYYVRESDGYVMIFALTEQSKVVLVRQYRYGCDRVGLELPAGMLERGENPKDCVRRELLEETGYVVEQLSDLGSFLVEPVRSNARAFIYMGRNARRVAEPQPEDTEHLEVELVPLSEFEAMLTDGRVDNLATLATGYRALDALGRTHVR